MKANKHIHCILCLIASAACLTACKKSDGPFEDYSYFSGSIRLPIERYIAAGDSKDFCVDTLISYYRTDGGDIGYYFLISGEERGDTLKMEGEDWRKKTFTFTAPDSLATYNAGLYGFAQFYYTTGAYEQFTSVRKGLNGDASLTNFDVSETDSVFTDRRDGKEYYTTRIGNKEWMRQNLAWNGAGIPGMNCRVMDDIAGMFYTWDEAVSACPEGWRLPSEADWSALASAYGITSEPYRDIEGLAGKLMENVYFNGSRMWEYWREVTIDNASRLSILPMGYAQKSSGKFKFDGFKSYALFWTSEDKGGSAGFRYIHEDKSTVFYGQGDKRSIAATVRCVRDIKAE